MRYLVLLSLLFSAEAFAGRKVYAVKCPVIVDRQSNSYSNSKAKYVCFASEKDAKALKYSKWNNKFAWFGGEGTTFFQSTINDLKKADMRYIYGHTGSGSFVFDICSTDNAVGCVNVENITGAIGGNGTVYVPGGLFYVRVSSSGTWFLRLE